MSRQQLRILIPLLLYTTLYTRSPFRTPDPDAACITARWVGQKTGTVVRDDHFRQFPLFTFGTEDIRQYLVPESLIYADKSGSISKKEIDHLITQAMHELFTRKRKVKKNKRIKGFKVLQYKNYSFSRGCGLIVLKFEDHPFVLKLFVEKPETFLNPYIKGMEPIFFHFMAGGVNRHVSGLTRVKNLELVKKIVAQDPLWNRHIAFPRKWYWLPKNNQEIELIGENLAPTTITQRVPGVYAIIADYIDTENQLDIPLYTRKRMVMQFSNDISTYLDPHFNNFIFHPDVIDGEETYKIVIVDTEHFPTIVGLEETKHFKTHYSWYVHLAKKCVHDMYFKTKQDLRALRTHKSPLCLDEPIFYCTMTKDLG